MAFDNIIIELALIFAGAAVLATAFLYLRQPIILSYILLGMVIGPYGLSLISQTEHVKQMSQLGIILLLFLIGLNLYPSKLITLFKETAFVTVMTCFTFALIAGATTYAFGYVLFDSIVVGLALMFSSTVIGLKLIPTTELHHHYIGEIMISVLLLQDILAIVIILFLKEGVVEDIHIHTLVLVFKGIALSLFSYYFVKYCIFKLFSKFDVIQEYIFVVALGWCMLLAAVAHVLGLSYEIGAFIAGVTLATSPIAFVISEKLKSLREFFLILFFFAVGSQFDLSIVSNIWVHGLVLAALLLIYKPLVFRKAFMLSKEAEVLSTELAYRLGQASEFALIVAYISLENNRISEQASYLIQFVVIVTFIVSTYLVSSKYKTPISVNAVKRAD